MAKVALVWEMGSEYGHISRLLTFGKQFRDRGHETVYILKDLSRAEVMIGPENARCYQAPHWIPTVTGLPSAVTSAETLIRFGYLEAEALTGICRAWRNLFELITPDLLFCDCAPTALLSARGTGIPTVVCDNGYGIPPAQSPLPSYRWWLANGPEPIEWAEERVLESINVVTKNLNVPAYNAVHEVFRAETTFLCTYKELDHYPGREKSRYWGAIANLTSGQPPSWPSGKGPRVFLYLRPDYVGLQPICAALIEAKARVCAFVPGIDQKTRNELKSRRLVFMDRPARMEAIRVQCDAAVCHAGLGTASAILSAGKPLLLLPTQTEQTMLAMRVRELGAGLVGDPDGLSRNADQFVRSLLENESLHERAVAFAKRYRGNTQIEAVKEIIEQCESIIG